MCFFLSHIVAGACLSLLAGAGLLLIPVSHAPVDGSLCRTELCKEDQVPSSPPMIQEFSEELYRGVVSALEEIDNTVMESSVQRKMRTETVFRFLMELKKQVLEYSFTSPEEEIRFFKEVKPRFTSMLIYYSSVDRIELGKPEGSLAHVKSYYEHELAAIDKFFGRNREIYTYFRSGDTYFDHQLFIRGNTAPRWLCKGPVDQDERFSTATDLIFARIKAKEQIVRYLENTINGLEFRPFAGDEPAINWTGDSINLLENVFGWYYTGQINNGQATIADLVRIVERVFNVNLGKPYRRFSEIRQRKRLSKTKFLEEMSRAINKKIEDDDEYRPGR